VVARRVNDAPDALVGGLRRGVRLGPRPRRAHSSAASAATWRRTGSWLLIDQDTVVQGLFVPFFGRPAWTPRAAGDLALRFRAPVAVIWSRRRGPGAGTASRHPIEAGPGRGRDRVVSSRRA
jgi:lauroyl/myristoyl acyltransferase